MRLPLAQLLAGMVVTVCAATASATNPAVTIEYQTEAGTFGGARYIYAEGFMTGTVPRPGNPPGTYKVPIVMYYPESGGNNVGVVELTNSGFFIFTRDGNGNLVACGRGDEFTTCPENNFRVFEKLIINFVPIATENYLWREGYVYMGVQWNKMVTEQMGPEPPDGLTRRRGCYGEIDQPTDAFEIARDAGRWLRAPTQFTGNGAPAVRAQTHLINYGYSNGAAVQRQLLVDDGNREMNGDLIYDGFFLYAIGAPCWIFDNTAPVYGNFVGCPGSPPTNGAKVLSVDTHSDMEVLSGAAARDFNFGTPQQDDNFVRWEVAGIAHIPPLGVDMGYKGTTRSNPVDVYPVSRAAFFNLTRWIKDDIEPAASVFMEGTVDAMGNLMTAKDEDGNPLGGLRLPHLGAPTGVYGGIDFGQLPMYFLNSLGGQYERFSDAELMARYPSEDVFRQMYNAAADDALEAGYILEEDHARYIAEPEDVPPPPDDEDDDEPAGDSGCCSASGDFSSPLLLGMFVGAAILRRRRRTRGKAAALAVVAVVAIAGCESSDPPGECIGHACPDATIDLPEGGEVRLELVYWENRAPEIRTYAWFAGQQAPETRPWPRDPAVWNIQDGADLCTDLRTGIFFPSSPPSERTYLDAGDVVTFRGPTEIPLAKKMNTRDLVFDIPHDILYMDEPLPELVVPGGTYDFEIAGGADLPAQLVTEALHVPADTQLTFPAPGNHITFPRGEDFRFFWDSESEDPFDFAFVAFADLYGPIGFCIGPQSGYMTIPASFIQSMPQAGSILHGLVNHNAVEREDGRKFDFLGINCRQVSYVVDAGI